MNAVVFEHVRLSELPAAWRDKLPKAGFARKSHVTVRIEQEEAPGTPADKAQADLQALMANPMFGMWADREDMADVAGYVRALRAPRLNADGNRRKRAA
ncbi:MAG: hypothetical protein WCH44_14845 [Betaproteobacteria bacterium]